MFDVLDRVESPAGAGGDPLEQLRNAIEAFASETRSAWQAPTLSDRLVEALELSERLDAAVIALTAQWNRKRAWEADAALSPASWLEHRAPVSTRDARSLVKAARIVDTHMPVADALDDGTITTGHLGAIERVMSSGREPLLADHADVLAEQAGRLSIRDFTTAMRRWAALADDELATEEFAVKWERRHLHASVTMDGWVVGDFSLDPVAGQSFLNSLDHLAPPDPIDAPDGARSLSQRRADALADLSTSYLNGGRPGGNPPNVDVLVDVATLNGDPPGLAQSRCDLDGVGAVSRATLEQICCSATITRIVTAGESIILDVGRKERTATPAQRRAVARRDKHCIAPSCRRSPRWCDVHHIIPWDDFGETNLDNLVLLCRRHHTLVHNTKWTVTRTDAGTFTLTHPARGP
ncbi:MAG: DUF222 domain-containing protein [Acidimicrobiia bacterium]|nr:DUF222 domain-containing protein [Acidimicrobiia bacterium]